MGGYAWVTLATNDAYSLGALVLAHSLRRVGTKYEMAILVTPGVTEMMRSKLAAVFSLVQEVNVLDSKDKANLALLARPELGITFTKLHCWRLTQYDKCVFLDADTLVVRNCDELFEREELSAAPDVGWPDCFNSGVFVYRPSQQTFSSITAFAAAKGSFDGGDQGLLNMYFSDWAQKDISKHLPFIYNICSTAAYSYLPAFKQFGEDVRIIHFIGITKPWLQYFDTLTGIVQPPPNCNHLQPLLQLWWNLFCEKVHPQLSPVMASSTLAPIWHQYNPTQFQSSAPRAPSNYTHMDDIYNDINAQKPDFSEFKDPWDEYCAQNTHYTQTNVENNSNNQYYCNNQNNERSQPSNSYTEQKSEHYNENQCQECQFSSECQTALKWHNPPQEQQQQYNAPCINNTQQHVFIQRENQACNVHFVEQSQPNYHDTHNRINHSISSNGTQQHSFSHEQHVEQFHSHNNGHSHHDQNQHNQNHMTNDYSYANNVSHHERRDDVDHQQHCNIHYQHTPEPPSMTQHQYHEQHSNIVHHNHEHYSSPPEQYSHVESNEQYNNDACMNAKNSEREKSENEVCQWQTSSPNHERDHRDVERQTDTQNSTSSPESIPCTESHKIATQSEPNVTEHLDSSSAGLAGALAKMTLGEPRSAEQIALEEHMRKQSWEHGQIDYMGRDSFDNIWKKICETLSLAPPRTSPPKEIPSSSEEQTEKADNKEQEEVEIPKGMEDSN